LSAETSFLAVDLGASSGRVMDCAWDGNAFFLREVHRFPNHGVRAVHGLYWDALGIWSCILDGLRKYRAASNRLPAAVGVDAWGVDFALLDQRGRLLANPYHYRDARTDGLPARLGLDARLFHATGVQTMAINTSFQLASMVLSADPQLAAARALLPIPDLFQYFLCGQKSAEFTEATTTQLYDPAARAWSRPVLDALQVPADLFPPVCLPGTVLGTVLPEVLADCGFSCSFPAIAVASHDTASAVAVLHLDDRSAFLSSGTWSLMGVSVPAPLLNEDAFHSGCTNEGSADGGFLLIRNLTGLWILQECMRRWAADGNAIHWQEIERAASAAVPFRSLIDPNAPEFQAPHSMPAAIAEFCARIGQPVPQTPGETARCIFESLSLSYRSTLDDLESLTGRTLDNIRLVGGGAKNHMLCQMAADACHRPVIAGPVEAAAFGNALVQAVATGHFSSLDQGRAALANSCEFFTFEPRADCGWHEAASRFEAIRPLNQDRKNQKQAAPSAAQ